MKWLIFGTDRGLAQLIIRVTLGVVMFPHGAQKVLGWFGGGGFEGTMAAMTKSGMPVAGVILLMAIELLGSMGLIVGFMTRVAALGIGGAMAICAMLNHVQNGFFMNWFGNQRGEGFEFHILVVGIAVALFIKGGGRFSIDRLISPRG